MISVVQSAIQRALRFSASPLPRSSRISEYAGQRQERREGKDREGHQRGPANVNQVMNAAAPMSMAKA